MLSLKKTKKSIPDLTEFTDEDGKKWIQTSADDLFSTAELNEIIDRIDKDKDKDEIILARFDFQKVNKEYYKTVLELEAKLKKQNDILKKLVLDAKDTIDRKNKKLKELVKYIRKLHLVLAYYKTNPEDIDKLIPSPDVVYYEPSAAKPAEAPHKEEYAEAPESAVIEYSDAEEIFLDNEGNEITL